MRTSSELRTIVEMSRCVDGVDKRPSIRLNTSRLRRRRKLKNKHVEKSVECLSNGTTRTMSRRLRRG